jgi:Putative DNA-binding domain
LPGKIPDLDPQEKSRPKNNFGTRTTGTGRDSLSTPESALKGNGMSLTNVDLERISEADLEALRENQVAEGILIDYKRDLYGSSDDDKREILKDISSFANTAGGHIVLGMQEAGGLPTHLLGVAGDLDAEMRRMENLLRDRMEPRLVGVRMQPVRLENGRRALVIRIPKSWNPPHAALHRQSRLFFARNSAGAHEASVEELRRMFTAGATLLDRARDFHRIRLDGIANNIMPLQLPSGGGRIVLHIIPFSAFSSETVLDPRCMKGLVLPPIWHSAFSEHYNIDGFLTTSGGNSRAAYLQVFRNGVFESAAGDVRAVRNEDQRRILFAESVEDHISPKVGQYMAGLLRAEVPPPMTVLLGWVRMHETFLIGNPRDGMDRVLLQSAVHSFPAVTLEDYGEMEDYLQALKPIFDALWNAAGYGGSQSYGADGVWKRKS